MRLGKVFRKMGLPAWAFIGIGVTAIWFNYLGALLEKLLRDAMGVNEQTSGFDAYKSQLIVFILPFVVVGAILLIQTLRHQTTKIVSHEIGALRQPEGKRGIILLVSNADSAMFAIEHHFEAGALESVWLIPSNDTDKDKFGSSTLPVAQEIKKRCEALIEESKRRLEVFIKKDGVSPADSQDTFDFVRKIFRNSGYQTDELIADFTGGTKPMSVGMIMACLPAERELEYVSLNKESGRSHGPFLVDYQYKAFDLIG